MHVHVYACVCIYLSQRSKADSTLRSSQAVPHPSTDRALRRLTSEVRRDPVHSTWYGRLRTMQQEQFIATNTV